MRYIKRQIQEELFNASKYFPSILLTGPRRSGKTTLLRKLFKDAEYVLLEDLDIIARAKADPRGFVEQYKNQVIIDEIQNVPELFSYIRTLIDADPKKYGKWILTGSQEAPLMQGVAESMAGRSAIFQLLPLSQAESPKVSLLLGGFPEVLESPSVSNIWFRSYLQTYLERDVRAITSIKDLSTFRRFLSVLATRVGSVLNKSAIAAPLGVSVNTLTEWLSILEITGQIVLLPPFYENFGKRLLKSPKIYFVDTGLLLHLLDVESEESLQRTPFLGEIFENFIISELLKFQINSGKRKDLYYFRDQQGLEVDLLVPKGNGRLALVELKSTRTIKPDMIKPIEILSKNIKRYKLDRYLVYPGKKQENSSQLNNVTLLSAANISKIFNK